MTPFIFPQKHFRGVCSNPNNIEERTDYSGRDLPDDDKPAITSRRDMLSIG